VLWGGRKERWLGSALSVVGLGGEVVRGV